MKMSIKQNNIASQDNDHYTQSTFEIKLISMNANILKDLVSIACSLLS